MSQTESPRDSEIPEQNGGPREVILRRDNFHTSYSGEDRSNWSNRDKTEPRR